MPTTLADPAVLIADLIGADESPGSWPMDPATLAGNAPSRAPVEAAVVPARPVVTANDASPGGGTGTGPRAGDTADVGLGGVLEPLPGLAQGEAGAGGADTAAGQRGDTVDGSSNSNEARARVVDRYRSAAMPWAMIISSASDKDAATAVFDAMTSRGVPCWMAQHSGCHATEADRTNDGLAWAAVVCPVLTSSADDDALFADVLGVQ